MAIGRSRPRRRIEWRRPAVSGSIEEWEDALIAARDAIDDMSADFMIADPALLGYLLEALEAFGRSCPD